MWEVHRQPQDQAGGGRLPARLRAARRWFFRRRVILLSIPAALVAGSAGVGQYLLGAEAPVEVAQRFLPRQDHHESKTGPKRSSRAIQKLKRIQTCRQQDLVTPELMRVWECLPDQVLLPKPSSIPQSIKVKADYVDAYQPLVTRLYSSNVKTKPAEL